MQRSCKTEGVAVALALHALGAAGRECFEIMEIACELRDALEELAETLGVAEVRRGLQREIEVAQAQHLAGAGVDEHSQGVFEDADCALEHEPVFGPVGEAFDLFRVCDCVHHLAQPAAHEFLGPRDRVEREQDAQEDEEHLTHGWEYNPRPGGGGIWGVLSPKLRMQVIDFRGDGISLSCSFVSPLSSISSSFRTRAERVSRNPGAASTVLGAPGFLLSQE